MLKNKNINEIKQIMSGRWIQAIKDITGIAATYLTGQHGPCPICGGTNRWRVYKDFSETGGAICNQCGQGQNGGGMGDGFAVIQWYLEVDFIEARNEVEAWLEDNEDFYDTPHSTQSESPLPIQQRPPCVPQENAPVPTPSPLESTMPSGFSSAEEAIAYARRSVSAAGIGDVGEPVSVRQFGPDASGRIEMEVRFEYVNSEGNKCKEFRPISWDGQQWKIGALSAPRPLYRLPQITTVEPTYWITVCEGCKAADAAMELGLMATTSPGGSNNAKNADWSPIAGRQVAIFPDNDKPGRKYAQQVAEILYQLDPSTVIAIVDLPGLQNREDMFDWVRRGGTFEQLGDIVDNTSDWDPELNIDSSNSVSGEEEQEGEQSEPFPIEVLPDPVRKYVEEAAAAVGCDPALVAVPLLASLAAAIGDSCLIELKPNWQEPPIIWAAVIAPSASQKSPAAKLAMAPLRALNSAAHLEFEQTKERYKAEKAIYEARFSAWKRRMAKPNAREETPPQEPEVPTCKRHIVSDITTEALAKRLESNPQGFLVFVDELGGWIGSHNAYRGGGDKDSACWLSLHSGTALSVDRVTGDSVIYVARPTVSLFGGIQPEVFGKLFGQNNKGSQLGSGLTQRFLVCQPPLRRKKWSKQSVDENVRSQIEVLVSRLVDLTPIITTEGERVPHIIRLSPAAEAAWAKFYNEHAKETHESRGAIRAHWGKLEAYAARLALVLHQAQHATGGAGHLAQISEKNMLGGIRLARWFGREAQRIYRNVLMLDGTVDSEQRDLLDFVRSKNGRVTVREVARKFQKYRVQGGSEKAEQALNDLVQKEIGCWETEHNDSGRGKPKSVFVLNENYDCDNNTLNPEENRLMSLSPPGNQRKTRDDQPAVGAEE